MNNNYLCKHKELDGKYNAFALELENQISQAAAALLRVADEQTFQIDLGEESLLVGLFESPIDGYPSLDSILIEQRNILVHVELNEGYHPLEDFTTFSIADKLAILEVIENQIAEFL